MSPVRIAVVGAGKRVLDTALPALRAAGEAYHLCGVYARSARTVPVPGPPTAALGAEVSVRPLDELAAGRLDGVDLVYLAVGKDATPKVLARLAGLAPRATDLLIETPVVRFRHFRHHAHALAFRSAWVAEDCARLPWFDTVAAAQRAGAIAAPVDAWFQHGAYAYHAVAIARVLLAAGPVAGARRTPRKGRIGLREVRFGGGKTARVLEPRDYGCGRLLVTCARGSFSDYELEVDGNEHLAVVEDPTGRALGFRLAGIETTLAPEEAALCLAPRPGASVTGRMEDMKRVGFLRLLRAVAAGEGAYPLFDGLEDMVVDYCLERLGRYVRTPASTPRGGLGRATLGLLTRGGG